MSITSKQKSIVKEELQNEMVNVKRDMERRKTHVTTLHPGSGTNMVKVPIYDGKRPLEPTNYNLNRRVRRMLEPTRKKLQLGGISTRTSI